MIDIFYKEFFPYFANGALTVTRKKIHTFAWTSMTYTTSDTVDLLWPGVYWRRVWRESVSITHWPHIVGVDKPGKARRNHGSVSMIAEAAGGVRTFARVFREWDARRGTRLWR